MSDNESALDDSPSHIVLDTEKLIFELKKNGLLCMTKNLTYKWVHPMFSFASFFGFHTE
jgi:hypothetical protein